MLSLFVRYFLRRKIARNMDTLSSSFRRYIETKVCAFKSTVGKSTLEKNCISVKMIMHEMVLGTFTMSLHIFSFFYGSHFRLRSVLLKMLIIPCNVLANPIIVCNTSFVVVEDEEYIFISSMRA